MLKYSVIIPVYNVEGYLNKCIESVLGQTTKSSFEIILVDDGSTDSSGARCDEMAESDERIRVIHQENRGCSAARNTGLQNACGEYVLFLDPDDYWDEELLSVVDELVSRSPDMAMFGVNRVYPNGKTEISRVLAIPRGENGGLYLRKVFQLGGIPRPYVWAYAYRQDFLSRGNLAFREDLTYSEDLEFNMRAIPLTECITGTERILYNWVARPESVTQSLSERSILDNLRCTREIYERYPVSAVANNYIWFALTLDKRYSGDLAQISASIEQNLAILKMGSGAAIKLGALLIRLFGYVRGRRLLWIAMNTKERLKGFLGK